MSPLARFRVEEVRESAAPGGNREHGGRLGDVRVGEQAWARVQVQVGDATFAKDHVGDGCSGQSAHDCSLVLDDHVGSRDIASRDGIAEVEAVPQGTPAVDTGRRLAAYGIRAGRRHVVAGVEAEVELDVRVP